MTVVGPSATPSSSILDSAAAVPGVESSTTATSAVNVVVQATLPSGRDDTISMSAEDLSALCFPHNLELPAPAPTSAPQGEQTVSLDELRTISEQTNKLVIKNTVSRQGRNLQRYSVEQSHVARLTTGTVPILRDGRILLVSSNKVGYVLPKGGWELDETMPVGAIRETFEEAGVIGRLGAPFPPHTYETRKALKRRLAKNQRNGASLPSPPNDSAMSSKASSSTSLSQMASSDASSHLVTPDNSRRLESEGTAPERQEHTHNCMTLFPLYVQHVCRKWPESHRHRLAVSIEEAEDLLSQRPEFLAILEIVKEHGLHRVSL